MQILLDVARRFIKWAADRDMGISDFAQGIKAAKAIRDCGQYFVFRMTGEVTELLRVDGTLRACDLSGDRFGWREP